MGAEEDIIDGTVANQIALRRFISREQRQMLTLFEKFDRRLAALLRSHIRKGMKVGSAAYKEMMARIEELRTELMKQASTSIRATLKGVAPVEADKEWAMLFAALGLGGKQPTTPGIQSILDIPFASSAASASILTDWLRNLKAADFRRIKDNVTQGVKEERTKDEIVAGAVGTRAEDFRDGQVVVTRNNIRTLVATSIVHASMVVREALWVIIPQVVGEMWLSILDRKTSAICRARDNAVTMFGDNPAPKGASLLDPPGARPPALPNCRSGMMALIRGMLPDRLTFDQWLRRRSEAFQNDVLGDAKGEMFRRGEFTLEEFVDNSGKEFTLEQLRAA